jgi:hypothetical protein
MESTEFTGGEARKEMRLKEQLWNHPVFKVWEMGNDLLPK